MMILRNESRKTNAEAALLLVAAWRAWSNISKKFRSLTLILALRLMNLSLRLCLGLKMRFVLRQGLSVRMSMRMMMRMFEVVLGEHLQVV